LKLGNNEINQGTSSGVPHDPVDWQQKMMNAVFSPYDFNNKRAFDSKMRFLKKINIFKRIKYSEICLSDFSVTYLRHFIKICVKKKEAQAGIEPALFCFQVEYLTNFTMWTAFAR
jgi:hypothetical protein